MISFSHSVGIAHTCNQPSYPMCIPGDGPIAETLTSMTITSNTNYAVYLLKKLVCSTIRVFVALQTVASRTMSSRYSTWLLILAIEHFCKDWRIQSTAPGSKWTRVLVALRGTQWSSMGATAAFCLAFTAWIRYVYWSSLPGGCLKLDIWMTSLFIVLGQLRMLPLQSDWRCRTYASFWLVELGVRWDTGPALVRYAMRYALHHRY